MELHSSSSLVSLLFQVALIVCVIINSSQADQPKQTEDDSPASIRDPVTDLGRLNSKPSSELPKQASDQLQANDQQAASANLESLVFGRAGSELAADEIVLDASQLPVGLQSLLPLGKRRFDAKQEELSSTGQLEGNKFVIPHTPAVDASEPLAAPSRGRKFQKRPLDGRMLSRIVDNGPDQQFASRVNEASDQLANMNQNYNRRALINAQQQMASSRARQQRKQQERQQQAPKRRLAGGRAQQSNRQESRKSQASSRAHLDGRNSREADKEKEEEEDGERASDRRSDAFDRDDEGATGRSARDEEAADRDERDDDDDDDDGRDDNEGGGRPSRSSSRPARGNKLRQAASASGRQLATRQRGSADEGDRESASDDEDNDDGDGPTDASNAQRVLLGQVQPRTATTNRKVIEVVPEPIEEGSSNLKQGAVINTELQAAAGHHHGHHGHYYQYVEVPKKKAWKFGFKRGNHKHEIARHEKGHKHKFHSSFKWHAKEKCKKKKKCKSVGKMTWEYKHHKKHHHRK